jgi:CheY-like chemotaxis protein
MPEPQIPPAFVQEIRRALHHMYNPDELAHSPLVRALHLQTDTDPLALQRVLLSAIDSLRPNPRVPLQTPAWRIYEALYHRYTEQFSQGEVARTLGLSPRQLLRLETAALRVLAERLWARCNQPETAGEWSMPDSSAEPTPPAPAGPAAQGGPDRYQPGGDTGSVLADEIIQTALKTVDVLRQRASVKIRYGAPDQALRVAVERVGARQALLNVLMAAIDTAPAGLVEVSIELGISWLAIRVRPELTRAECRPADAILARNNENLEIARTLLDLSGGRLELDHPDDDEHPFLARLVMPIDQHPVVLFIDDNTDTLQLFERYLTGSRYRFAGCANAQQALTLARRLKPSLIVLDVMLSGMDGWEVLEYLREDVATCSIPVVTCSILPEEALALSLGAVAFCRKPVSQLELLAALDLAEAQDTGCDA